MLFLIASLAFDVGLALIVGLVAARLARLDSTDRVPLTTGIAAIVLLIASAGMTLFGVLGVAGLARLGALMSLVVGYRAWSKIWFEQRLVMPPAPAEPLSTMDAATAFGSLRLKDGPSETVPQGTASTEEQARLRMLDLLEHALHGSSIIIAQQDRDLRYTNIFNPMQGYDDVTGKTDADILPANLHQQFEELKRGVLGGGPPVDTECELIGPSGTRWLKVRIEPSIDGAEGLTSIAVDVTAEKQMERHLRSLLQELTHRSRNLLAVIQGIARRTAASTHDVDLFVERFSGRLQALAAAHDVLIDQSWRGATLRELVNVQLSHLGAGTAEQLHVEGAAIILKPEAAQHFSLALHELATNAVEHGALSRPGGSVSLTWGEAPPDPERGPNVEFVWREEGGPPVTEPIRSGFGQIVLDRLVPRGLDGSATLEFLPDGLVWRLSFPPSNLLDADAG